MISSDRPLLVFALTRRGCQAYARQMIAQLPGELVVYCSAFTTEPPLPNCTSIKTYRNSFEFVLNSICVLPALMWAISRQVQRRQCKVAYFPVFHHWNLPLLWYCRHLGIKTILTVHDGTLHRGEQKRWDQKWQDYSILIADEVIFLSQYVRETVLARLPVRAHTRVIPHVLLPLPHFVFHQRQHREDLRLLFLGRISPYKGIELLLEAVEGLSSKVFSHLTIAGMPIYEPPIPKNKPNIRYLPGWATESDLSHLLQTHDVLVLPYTEATQSGVITLGIQAGIPMIVTKVGGLPEQLEEHEALWVNPNSEDIRTAILRLSASKELYESLCKNPEQHSSH